MKIYQALIFGAIAGISALAVSSCAYDPYYSESSYSTGYGNGFGYGSSNFSTSLFVRTGSPRWGYDPYAGCYYDYNRRAYYDPYLCGYYPVGYRPRYVSGSPHPHGWRRGNDYISQPSEIRSHNLTHYQNRTESYRSLNREWSHNVNVAPAERDHRQAPNADDNRRSRRDGEDRRGGSRESRSDDRRSSRGKALGEG